jgi:hypothetical protein
MYYEHLAFVEREIQKISKAEGSRAASLQEVKRLRRRQDEGAAAHVGEDLKQLKPHADVVPPTGLTSVLKTRRREKSARNANCIVI